VVPPINERRRPGSSGFAVPAGSIVTQTRVVAPSPRRIRVGIDTGGTFTDVVAVDESGGDAVAVKTPSTPDDPARGFLDGIGKALAAMDAGPAELVSVSHGTTVATNQLLEGDLGRLGFITTEGFEHLLEIARQSVPDGYGNSYFWVKPPRIVPADRVRTVGGRLDHTGAEVRPFDADGAAGVARWFREHDVRTIGVCLLHSYANPAHEEAMRAVLAREHPDAVVSVSSDVLREYREYERAMTTLVDAAVKPRVSGYVARLRGELDRLTAGHRVPFHIMKSNGGVLSADEVVRQPITTVLSGPAAGALGAAMVARAAGFDQVITLDGGGTSTDVSVVLGGDPTLTTEGSVGGFPAKIPMIDIVTVGAGGGSVAWLSPESTLKVGPRSAGADPGPMCYARGGREPTVTDAHLVLGRIPPHLLAGEVPLDPAPAYAGLAALGTDLGLDAVATALGVLEISAWNQANALRQITVQRGLDVRDFALTTFGGSGSLMLCRLIDIVGVPVGVVPRDPGNLSAFGLLTVDVRVDQVRTYVCRQRDLDPADIDARLARLRDDAAVALAREGFAEADRRYEVTADLRYYGQAFEVRVPVELTGAGGFDAGCAAATVARFHDAHELRYGYCFRDRPRQEVEWVNLRVTGVGPIRRPGLTAPATATGVGPPPVPKPTGERPVCFERADGFTPTPTYWRADLPVGTVLSGPSIVEEYGATLPLHPGFDATVDALGNLVVTRSDPAVRP
jgi:N-methylhydantoinase A